LDVAFTDKGRELEDLQNRGNHSTKLDNWATGLLTDMVCYGMGWDGMGWHHFIVRQVGLTIEAELRAKAKEATDLKLSLDALRKVHQPSHRSIHFSVSLVILNIV
jgi:hypothetical protein